MNRKTIKIKSNQIFEEQIDTTEEIHECILEKLENGIKVVYDNTIIMVTKEKAIIKRENTEMIIACQKKTITQYSTPYGMLVLEIEGKHIEIVEEPFFIQLRYQIKMENAKEYVNELQIMVVENE